MRLVGKILVIFVTALACNGFSLFGALYQGNRDTSFGGAVGMGSLGLTDDGTTVSGTFSRGTGNFADVVVIFIDSVAGGFSSTAGFTDRGDSLRTAISGYNSPGNQAKAYFTSGFTADYAIALRGRATANAGELFRLVNNGSFVDVGSVNLSPIGTQTSPSYSFNFKLADIGLAPSSRVSFNIETSYIGDTAFRSLESFETLTEDSIAGWDTVTFNSMHTYVTAVPEPANVALAVFAGLGITGGLVSKGRSWFRARLKNTG